MIRNAATNDFKDNFEEWDERELERRKQQAPFFNDKLLSQEDREEIADAWRNKRSKPIRFKDNADDERPPEARVNEAELCAQFYAVVQLRDSRKKDVYKQVLVRHQIVTQAERRRLAEWNKRAEQLEPLLQPVHFQIYCKRNKYAMLGGDMGQMERLQSHLVLSHFDQHALLPRDLVQQVEHYLSVSLVRLILHQGLLLLLFEWLDVQHFALVLGFTVHLKSEVAQRLTQAQVVNLQRPDLLAFQELEEMAQRQGDDANSAEQQLSETKRALQGAFISYITAGYVKRDGDG